MEPRRETAEPLSAAPPRPPWGAVALVLAGMAGVGGWMMAHMYDSHDPGICGGRYERARTAADSAEVDRFVPDSERGALQPRSCRTLRGPSREEFAIADTLLERAIAATGGDSALTRLTALEWEGTATFEDGARERAGRWRVLPPDTELVTIWDPTDSASSLRRVSVMGTSVWVESGKDAANLTPAEQRAERHLVYEYGVARVLPLRTLGTLLWPLPRDAAGRPGVRVRASGRLDTEVYFGADGRVEVIRTTTFPVPGGPASHVTATFSGTTEVAGVHWFRELRIEEDGRPRLHLTITAARPASAPPSAWLAGTGAR